MVLGVVYLMGKVYLGPGVYRGPPEVYRGPCMKITRLNSYITYTWVTDSRMLCSLPRSCLVHPVDRFNSKGWFSSDQVIF